PGGSRKAEVCKGRYQSGNRAGEQCQVKLKAGNNGFCARHARQGDSRDDEDEDVGDESLSDDGSEAEYPGDLGDHDGSGECQLTKATATKFGRDRGIAK
ncbi:unnamed protein product, partial [Pylaiella littoralis]